MSVFYKKNPHLIDRLGSGPHVVGRLGSEMWVSASFSCSRSLYIDWRMVVVVGGNVLHYVTRGQSNLTKSASRGAHSPVRGHPRGSKVVPLNS